MIFALAILLDRTLASLHDPILAAFVLPNPEVFARILGVSLAVTAGIVPVLIRQERRRRAARAARLPDAEANAAA